MPEKFHAFLYTDKNTFIETMVVKVVNQNREIDWAIDVDRKKYPRFMLGDPQVKDVLVDFTARFVE